jgi:hypothetical protein
MAVGGTMGADAGAQTPKGAATGADGAGTQGAAGGLKGASVPPFTAGPPEACGLSTVGAMVTTGEPIDVAALVGAAVVLVGKDGFLDCDTVGELGVTPALDKVGAGDGLETKFLAMTALES